jgi:hypothetical protein
MEAAQRPGNADECGGDIAAPGRAKTRKPAARIAVKGHAHHRTDDEDDDEVDKGGAAVGSIRVPSYGVHTAVAHRTRPMIGPDRRYKVVAAGTWL